MTPEQAAKEAWENSAKDIAEFLYQHTHLQADQRLIVKSRINGLLQSYQTSLKKLVEARKIELRKRFNVESSKYRALVVELDWILESIDTAMPPTK
jgi:hypothetical protein